MKVWLRNSENVTGKLPDHPQTKTYKNMKNATRQGPILNLMAQYFPA